MSRLPKFLLLLIPALTACTGDPYQDVYENIKRRNEAPRALTERATPPRIPSYKEYKQERERLNSPEEKTSP